MSLLRRKLKKLVHKGELSTEDLDRIVIVPKDDTLCAECGRESETLYMYEGDWVCEECLRNMAERVDTE